MTTPDRSAAISLARGIACGEDADIDEAFCTVCEWVVDPDDTVEIAGQVVCEACVVLLIPDARDADTVKDCAA